MFNVQEVMGSYGSIKGIHYGQEIQTEIDTLKTNVITKPNILPAPEADQDATIV